VFGALVVAFAAGAVTLVAGQTAFAAVKSPVLRVAIALLFATPAAIAGYHATLALAQISVPSASWRVFAVVGAIFVGGTAFVRVAAMATPPAAGHIGAVAPGQPRMTAASRQG
jgi:intracellular septation protein A